MRRVGQLTLCLLLGAAMTVRGQSDSALRRFGRDIKYDYVDFYSYESLAGIGAGLVVGGVLANTSMDQEIQDFYQDSVRGSSTDSMSDIAKLFGDRYTTPSAYVLACVFDVWADESPVCAQIGEWGKRSIRTLLVGGPLMLVLQRGTGASRPNEDEHGDEEVEGDSSWSFFDDSNGVSGHSFMGAVPFITAAKMTDDPVAKALLYSASTLCGLSRINDDDHYFSQSFLGWWLAYLAATAVDRPDAGGNQRVAAVPFIYDEYSGLSLIVVF